MPEHTVPIPAPTAQPTRNTPHPPDHGQPDIILHVAMGEHALCAEMAVAQQVVVVAEFFGGVRLDAGYVGPAGGGGGGEGRVEALGVCV